MPDPIQQSIVKYLNMARTFPDIVAEHRRLLAQNLFLLNLLRTGRNSQTTANFLNGQAQIYQQAEKSLNEMSQKHSTARQLIDKYPEFRDKMPGFTGLEVDLSFLDAPMIAAITLLTGSILTLYDEVTNKIRAQNDILTRLQEQRQKLNDGAITQQEYDSFVSVLEVSGTRQPGISLGGVLVITGLIFGGYYAINNFDKVEKKLRKALNP